MMLQELRQRLNQRYQSFLDRRIPPAKSITLNRKNIFIFPSRPGLYFLVWLFVLLVAAINYENNIAFALVFLLVGLFIIGILHTYANLSAVKVSAVRASSGFAGDTVEFELLVSKPGNSMSRHDISLSWPDSDGVTVSLDSSSKDQVKLNIRASRRGLLRPGRLTLETVYPLGLVRAWSYLAVDLSAIIFPKPIASDLLTDSQGDTDEGHMLVATGADEFYGFKDYVPGDPLKHVYWKSYAKGQPLTTKHFASYQQTQRWLEWDNCYGDIEHRLSQLCYWVLKLEQRHQEYGLRIPGFELKPDTGPSHQIKALKALALFGESS